MRIFTSQDLLCDRSSSLADISSVTSAPAVISTSTPLVFTANSTWKIFSPEVDYAMELQAARFSHTH